MLTDSATAMLREKASTFLGSDLVVGVNRAEPLPAALASKATLVLRASTNDDGTSVDVLGIDPGSFARAVGPNPSDRDVEASSRPSRALTTSRRRTRSWCTG